MSRHGQGNPLAVAVHGSIHLFRDGQQVAVYLGEDRQLYIDTSPGKILCQFTGRVWIREKVNSILSITHIPEKFDRDPVKAPPGWEVQGLED